MSRLNLPQRIVLVVALAVLLYALRDAIIGAPGPADLRYTSSDVSGVIYGDGHWETAHQRYLSMGFTVVWAAVSLWLLGARGRATDADHPV